MVDSKPSGQPAAPKPSLLRQGLIAGWWTPLMDRHGPANPAMRFVVGLVPFLVLFGLLGVVYLATR